MPRYQDRNGLQAATPDRKPAYAISSCFSSFFTCFTGCTRLARRSLSRTPQFPRNCRWEIRSQIARSATLARFMNLSARQRSALETICDTFAPAGNGWPSASEMGVPDAIARGLESAPRNAVRAQFLQLLDFWDSRLH